MEGMRRGDVGPFEWVNSVRGKDCIREYRDDSGRAVARMVVADSNTDKPSYECERAYLVRSDLLERCAYIYIPSQAEWDAWDDLSIDDPLFDPSVDGAGSIDPGYRQ